MAPRHCASDTPYNPPITGIASRASDGDVHLGGAGIADE
jgi:hypothetical protein